MLAGKFVEMIGDSWNVSRKMIADRWTVSGMIIRYS